MNILKNHFLFNKKTENNKGLNHEIVDQYKPKVLVQNSYVKNIFQRSLIFKEADMHIARLDVRKDQGVSKISKDRMYPALPTPGSPASQEVKLMKALEIFLIETKF